MYFLLLADFAEFGTQTYLYTYWIVGYFANSILAVFVDFILILKIEFDFDERECKNYFFQNFLQLCIWYIFILVTLVLKLKIFN